eukprot:scaffold16482_cov388-Ochromonas_danica.AAC.1
MVTIIAFITKVIQVHETQLVRHGMMVVGEADGFYKPVDRLLLNPKAITAGELYGGFNLLTNEWHDGIVPKLVRECVASGNEGSLSAPSLPAPIYIDSTTEM